MQLVGKTILIISPQPWGNMLLSKQHYAIELFKRGNSVYFLNPPIVRSGIFLIRDLSLKENSNGIIEISYKSSKILYLLRHKLRKLYNLIVPFIQSRIAKKAKIDIVWNFEPNLYSNMKCFKGAFNIYHPVDFLTNKSQLEVASSANILFSVATEILSQFKPRFSMPMFQVHHGVSNDFLAEVNNFGRKKNLPNSNLHCGYSGNLLRNDVNTIVLEKIIEENKNITFHFFGHNGLSDSNLGPRFSNSFVSFLNSSKNVILHGVLSQLSLAKYLSQMDILLICYDPERDMCRGTNYHKVIEYLATGNVIVSNHITTYSELNLFPMCKIGGTNEEFINLFSQVVCNFPNYNTIEMRNRRIEFAKDNTYAKQIERINKYLNEVA